MKIPIVNDYNFDEVVGHIKGNEIILRDELKIDMQLHYLSLGFKIKKVEVLPNGNTRPIEMNIICASLHQKLNVDLPKKLGWFERFVKWVKNFIKSKENNP